MSEQPDILTQYADANQAVRETAHRLGAGYDETPEWRGAERTAEQLWSQARAEGHSPAAISAARPSEETS
ncbi:hypothetical protein [Streptomyces cylindrosporus]|uniref:Uncharacterized protein n=1 Tax=Streptomyces cylindrosporus TaxID=2927583 RepID=A0ABS9YK33_9ACTN|nr:hypothetical protein [Streptomyces cylindrosporus]MCI3277612.1 hypothetical protein [Streptomyces cylindrosporus]